MMKNTLYYLNICLAGLRKTMKKPQSLWPGPSDLATLCAADNPTAVFRDHVTCSVCVRYELVKYSSGIIPRCPEQWHFPN
jgi:hypothetical protein